MYLRLAPSIAATRKTAVHAPVSVSVHVKRLVARAAFSVQHTFACRACFCLDTTARISAQIAWVDVWNAKLVLHWLKEAYA